MEYTRTEKVIYRIETKPCPFCGSQPKFYYDGGCYGYTPSKATMECSSCGANISIVSYENDSEDKLIPVVVKAWNRRID